MQHFTVGCVHVLLLLGLAFPNLPLQMYKIVIFLLLLSKNNRNSGQQMSQLSSHRGPVCVAESSTSTCKRCEEE